jgi:23S rRNA (uracil1939-C5)-methyltransferase
MRFDLLPLASRQVREIHLADVDNGVWLTSEILTQSPPNETEPFYSLDIQGKKLKLAFSPSGFIQTHAEINQKMVHTAIEWLALSAQDHLLDLFCGVGNFSLPAALTADVVTGVEGNAQAVSHARQNAQTNGLTNCHFFTEDLSQNPAQQAWWRGNYTAVLLDPGRLGAFEVCRQLGQLNVNKILYVSCQANTMIRDIQQLEQQGYRVKRTQLFDMFPQTEHFESLVLLERN